MSKFYLFQLEGRPTPMMAVRKYVDSFSASHFLILFTIPTSCKYLFCRFPGPFFVFNITQKFHSIKTSEASVTRIAILCIAIQRYKLIRRFETLPKQKAKTEVLTSFCFAWSTKYWNLGTWDFNLFLLMFVNHTCLCKP